MRIFPQLALWVLLFIGLTGCQQDGSGAGGGESTGDTLTYSISTIEREQPCADNDRSICLNVKIDQVHVEKGSSRRAREKIEAHLIGQLSITDNTDRPGGSAEAIADDLATEYNRITSELPDYKLPWEYFRDFDVYLNRNGLFGTKLTAHSFTGGAHPVSFEYYYTFDSRNGKALSPEDLFLPKFHSQLMERAEKQFRESRQIDPGSSYEDAGFWFEKDEFALPENFRYTSEKLVFLYNPYEIAPYAEGGIEVVLDYGEIENWVRPEYRLVD